MKIYDNAIFFPSISIATHISLLKNNWKVNNKSPRFYLNNTNPTEQMFHHPYILTSAAHNYKDMEYVKNIGINDLTKDINMIFGDSGGFQLATGQIKEEPDILEKLYTWMESNSTLGPIIDYPPRNIYVSKLGQAEIDDGLTKTKNNIDVLLKRPMKEGYDWLNVVQGNNYEHRVYWYNNVKDMDFYSGWALGTLKRNAYVILTAFASLMDNGELERERCKLIHFFVLTSTKYMPLAVYLKHKINMRGYNVNISFDSSYGTQNGGWGKYLLFPSSTGFTSYHMSNKLVGKFKDVPLPCSCNVCSGVRLLDILNEKALTNEGESLFYNVVQSHNVYVLTEYVKMLHSLIYSDCKELLATAFKSEQLKIFNVIDKMFDAPQGNAFKVLEEYAGLLNKYTTEDNQDISEMFEGVA